MAKSPSRESSARRRRQFKQLTVALRRAVTEYVREMCALFSQADGHRRFRRLLARYTGRTVTDTDLGSELDKLADESWDFTPEAARTLSVAFEEEKRALAGERLAGLNREYEKWVLAKATAKNDRERTLARTRRRELEEEITAWEGRRTPLDAKLADLRSRLAAHKSRLEVAFRAISGGSNRRKAEGVRELDDGSPGDGNGEVAWPAGGRSTRPRSSGPSPTGSGGPVWSAG